MIVYADKEEAVDTASFRQRAESASDPLERLILRGQFEAGVADALCPEADNIVDLNGLLPASIVIRPPEGYAFYSLYPEMYQHAALRFAREQRPGACIVIGIRSIGASLSAVVAEAVGAAIRFTVRPRGHPFDRRVNLGPALEKVIAGATDAWFLVVDEGPGLSGSSFVSVAGKLEELGVPAERIVLFPSHDPDPSSFKSERARANWPRYKKYVEEFRPERFVPSGAADLSGGAWRKACRSEAAVLPGHERRKYLHEKRLWKFSGLAHLGRARYERAKRLTAFCPRPLDFDNGFLISEWVEAEPATLTEGLLDAMARYLAFLRSEFATGRTVRAAGLENMVEVNTGARVRAPVEGVVIEGDGRMLPQEWLYTSRGYIKTDALDHYDDHFFPGCQDVAWDIAGASVEWGFAPEALLDRYLRLQPDAKLYSRIGFYVTAYRAYRWGYCTMAAESLGCTADGNRFRALLPRYSAG